MNIIQPANTKILEKLENCFNDYTEKIRYRIAQHVIGIESDNHTTLLYNVLTKEIVEVGEDEDVFNRFFLTHLFIVPETFQEPVLAMLVRSIYESQRTDEIKPMGYTILTTTACNARCFYCYEKGEPKKPMSEQTAHDVADFIAKNFEKYNVTKDGKKTTVRLSWFGGEPLFRKKCIDIICSDLISHEIPFSSSMISNGYLFNEETVGVARALWNLRNVQITVDGTRDIYNKTKAYIYKDEDPFETIMSNINRLTTNKIRVSIRINVGMFNIEDVEKLIDEIAERFKGNKFVSVYLHSLFDAFNSDMTSEESNRIVFTKISELEQKLVDMGLGSAGKPLDNSYSGTHCMADSGKHLCILTDGRLTLCEHYVNDHEIGTIYNFPEKVNYEMVSRYREIKEPFPQCYGCPLLVNCSYLKICADNDAECTEARKDYLIERLVRRVKGKYKRVKEEEKKILEEENEIDKLEEKSTEC